MSGDEWKILGQSAWFHLLVAGAVLVGLWQLHRLQVTRLAHRSYSEERARRRERIVRELHDTLLQDVQGLILRFQAVTERIPAEQEARAELEAALAAADDVVAQARDQAYDLHVEDLGDLYAALEEIVATTPFDPRIEVRILVEGKPMGLQPSVAAEVARIVREALFNIALHAQARVAEIAVGFETTHLVVRIRDYGVGIAGHATADGVEDGHFGLIGMRERADRIGGNLTIHSTPGDGCEVTLILPARRAFAGWTARRNRGCRLFKRPRED